eukprot:gb/GECH01011364.1/.p1 GENE.gb/GECH01011364.1/~~gb/GECH01011364.1/.p1  ORF type:complete len:275 (+),score=51.12 gb/GECH01011364.1/:1-825(+)
MPQNYKVGFIGSGAMATAIIKGTINAGLCEPSDITTSDKSPQQLARMKEIGVNTTSDNEVVARDCNIIVLAVKPNIVNIVLNELSKHLKEDHLIVSIAAGVKCSSLLKPLPGFARVARVMPNTNCLVGASASAFCLAGKAGDADATKVRTLFASVGSIVQVPEYQLDAVTGVSGSGPAYVLLFIEALADGGVNAGLPRNVAMQLAAQTVYGTALSVKEGDRHPGAMKDLVCSPGGTTISAVRELERNGLRSTVIEAVTAAFRKSIELGKPNSSL